jgi:hypothetical protein
MKWFAKITGAIFAISGFISDTFLVIAFISDVTKLPEIPNPTDIITLQIWCFVISTLLMVAGILMFLKYK